MKKYLYDMKSNFFIVFILKCVSVTNLSTEHYTEGIARQ